MLQCSSSSTSSSELSFFDEKVGVQNENGGAKLKEQFEYLVCEFGWRVRRLIENADEMKMAAQVQAEAFHVPVALFDDMFFQFFKVLFLSFFFSRIAFFFLVIFTLVLSAHQIMSFYK